MTERTKKIVFISSSVGQLIEDFIIFKYTFFLEVKLDRKYILHKLFKYNLDISETQNDTLLTFPLAVPPETPIRKGVLLSIPFNFPLIPKDIFREVTIFIDISAIVKDLLRSSETKYKDLENDTQKMVLPITRMIPADVNGTCRCNI